MHRGSFAGRPVRLYGERADLTKKMINWRSEIYVFRNIINLVGRLDK